MPRHNWSIEGLVPGKIRKRGCSSSVSSSSSVIQNYRFKRAILVGKRGGSGTPVSTCKLMSLRSPASRGVNSSPRYQASQTGGGCKAKQQAPVSARKLAATLWEMNETPSPRVKESSEERRLRRELRTRERAPRSMRSGSLPPHLSDPSHSPVSERMNRSGTGSRRRAPSVSLRPRLTDHGVGALDTFSNASYMEVETRSRAQTSRGSTFGSKTCLKDVSNALTTSKELLKIINRMWGHDDRPSSSMSLISALHAELERARLQVNQYIHEQRTDQNDLNYFMKRLADEKAAWKSKEQEVVEAAIESIAGELDIERKLRRRFESLNKKLGKELSETKAALLKSVKELENEKREREIVEQVCEQLAMDIGSNEGEEGQELKRESAKIREVEKEREIMQLADKLHKERVQMKHSGAKYQLEEKNTAIAKLRNQLEAFLGTKKSKETGCGSVNHSNDEEIASYFSKMRHGNKEREEEEGTVDNGVDCEENSAESDLHSIELNMDNNDKCYKWTYAGASRDIRRATAINEVKGRRSTSERVSRRSTSLQRSISDGVEQDIQTGSIQNAENGLHWDRISELQNQVQGNGYTDELHRYKPMKGLKSQILSGSKIRSSGVLASPTRQWGQPWPSRDPSNATHERPPMVPGSALKSRLATGEVQNARKSKR